MKKNVLAILFLATAVLLAVPVRSEEPKGPRMEIKEASYDFGNVIEGTKVKHVFEISNSGDEVLVIQQVQAS